MNTTYYIDGFNLYHLRLKPNRRFRWLNVKLLADQLSPAPSIVTKINFYTARVSTKIDPDAPARQRVYLKALSSERLIEIHYGRFLFGERLAKLAVPLETRPQPYVWNLPAPILVKINKIEEKGSDVNLASHLIRDAFLNKFDTAVVVSNDTDLVEPIRIVTQEIGRHVGIVAPKRPIKGGPPIPSPSLKKYATFVLYIDNAHLTAAQFPQIVTLADGTAYSKPPTWV
jgi:uncharacterized LabA/DUF88 family protein